MVDIAVVGVEGQHAAAQSGMEAFVVKAWRPALVEGEALPTDLYTATLASRDIQVSLQHRSEYSDRPMMKVGVTKTQSICQCRLLGEVFKIKETLFWDHEWIKVRLRKLELLTDGWCTPAACCGTSLWAACCHLFLSQPGQHHCMVNRRSDEYITP